MANTANQKTVAVNEFGLLGNAQRTLSRRQHDCTNQIPFRIVAPDGCRCCAQPIKRQNKDKKKNNNEITKRSEECGGNVVVHHKRKSRVVSLWSPSCLFLPRKGPIFLVPSARIFPPFSPIRGSFSSTPHQFSHQSPSVSSRRLPHRTRSSSTPLKDLGLSSFLPASFQLRPGPFAASRSVRRFLLHASQKGYKNRLGTPVS